MSSRSSEEKKPSKLTEDGFDFAETSDLCDFGYVLAGSDDRPSTTQPANAKPSK
jgi:hypothetical protein